ncbi:MAG: glycosyltransferase family 39 protein, partial [Thermoplasmatota archaeon]
IGITWESIWVDEALTGLRANMNLWDVIDSISPMDHLPLYFTSIWALDKIVGNSVLAIRMPSAILGALTVVPVYLIGCRISKRTGMVAAILAALNPTLIFYSQEARMYAPMAFLAALSLYYSMELVRPSRISTRKAVAGLIITNSLLFYLHYFSAVFIALETLSIAAAAILLDPERNISRDLFKMAPNIASFMIFLPWLLFILIRYPLSGHTTFGDLKLSWSLIHETYLFLGGMYDVHDLFFDPDFGATLVASMITLLFGVFGAIMLLVHMSKDEEKLAMALFLLPLLLLPAFIVYAVSLIWQPIYNYRYFIFMLPALMVLASIGIEKVRGSVYIKWERRRAVQYAVVLVVPLLLIISDAGMMARKDKDDWKGAALFIDRNLGENDIIIARPDYQRYTLYYYVWNLPVGNLSGDIENDTILFEAHDVVWVVTYYDREYSALDFMDILRNRTEEHFDGFAGLNVWRFSIRN